MCDRKSQTSEMIQSMIHGKPTGLRQKQPSMFELLSWHDQNKKKQDQKFRHGTNNMNYDQAQQIHERICDCDQNCQQTQIFQDNDKLHYENSLYNASPIIDRKKLKPHQIHNNLYMIETVKLRKQDDSQQQCKKLKTQPTVVNQKLPLDPNNAEDRKIIEQRKKRIKDFNKISRDLPNSAFTTYYGKPAFEAYGRCNSQKLKTHNIMPHKGDNRPNGKQCYQSALIKGKKMQNKTVYVPRKPLEELRQSQEQKLQRQDKINIPIKKPDLINHIRFSKSESKVSKKQKLPQKTKIKKSKSSIKNATTNIFGSDQSKKNKKKQKSLKKPKDGLKYMNIRDDLLDLLEKKKMKQSKLAYKVTECYPLKCKNTNIDQQYCQLSESLPAGKQYQRGFSAKQIMYQKTDL